MLDQVSRRWRQKWWILLADPGAEPVKLVAVPGSIVVRGARAETPDRVLFTGLDLTVTGATKLGIVGANGSGKSTLLAMMARLRTPSAGHVERQPGDLSVGLLRQEPDRSATETGAAWLTRVTGVADAEADFEDAAAALADGTPDTADRYDRALDRWTRLGCADFDARLAEVAAGLGLAAPLLAQTTQTLSGGEAARLALSAVELSRFDVLLLDEPTNDLDLAGLARLERFVAERRGGLVLVSHDRAFLEATVTSVLDLTPDGPELFAGGWQAYLDEKERRHELAVEAFGRFDREKTRLSREMQKQREWEDQGKARIKRKAGDQLDKHQVAAQKQRAEKRGGAATAAGRALDRLDDVDKPWEGWDLRFEIAIADRAGSRVMWWDDAVVTFDGVQIGPFTDEIVHGERVHLAGPNGSGKTSLLQAALGEVGLTSGMAAIGPSIVVGIIDQQRDSLDGQPDAVSWLATEAGLDVSEARSILAKFGLTAEHLGRPVPTWSTGERTRAHLAMLQARGVNLVVLDEPTNHLDLEAIEQVEQALASYEGTVVVISHDRRFVEHLEPTRTVDLG